MECVRFSLMDAMFLIETVETSPLVRQHAFVVMQAHREAVTKMDTVRTCRRCQLRFEDLKVGMKVRIMHDLEYVSAECEKAAPGAEDAVLWAEEMAAYVGEVATITKVEGVPVEGEDPDSDDETVLMAARCQLDADSEVGYYWFPFHVLEHV